MVSPCATGAPEDIALLTLAWKLNYVQDVVLIAHILNINLADYAKFKTNDKFLTAFVNECNAILTNEKHGATKTIVLDPNYVAAFDHPQILHKVDEDHSIFVAAPGTEQESFTSIFQGFYDSIKSIKLRQKRPNNAYANVWGRRTNGAMPSIRWHSYIKADDQEAEPLSLFDSRVTFTIDLKPEDALYNPKIPDFVKTNIQVSKSSTVKLSKDGLIKLWGGLQWPSTNATGKKESAVQSGCIFLRPLITYSYHAKGSPSVEFQADTLVLHRVNKSVEYSIDGAGDFFQSDDEGEEKEAAETESSMTFGNANDLPPDAL